MADVVEVGVEVVVEVGDGDDVDVVVAVGDGDDVEVAVGEGDVKESVDEGDGDEDVVVVDEGFGFQRNASVFTHRHFRTSY